MLITREITDVSPLFMLERSGNDVTITMASSAYGYYDEDLGYYLWDGEIFLELGTESVYYYQDIDRPLDAVVTEALAPGVATAGNYYVNYGQYEVAFNVILFDAAADFAGSSGRDYVFGSGFGDRLAGNGDDDGFEAAGGDDVINGGAGADLIDGGAGVDTASYVGALSGAVVYLGKSAWNGGAAIGDRLISIENLAGTRFADSFHGDVAANRLVGGSGTDFLFGRGGDDVLDGGADADAVLGGAGNDLLLGGGGGDLIDGGAGIDTASYANAAAGVAVSLISAAVAGGDAAGDILLFIENLTGSKFDDRLSGDSGVNVIKGGRGNDVIRGNGGADVLSGEAGRDSFLFNVLPAEPDEVAIVLDYATADDRILLDNDVYRTLATGRLVPDAFALGTEASAASHRILYDPLSGEIRYDADGTGAIDAVVIARLVPGQMISEGEFRII